MFDSLEQLKAVSKELLVDVPNPPRLNRLEGWLQKAHQRFQDELKAYRDQLEEAKVQLGLSPHVAIIPDRTSLVAFRSAFEKVDVWFRDPDRDPAKLPAMITGLPRLETVILGQIPLSGVSEADPNRLEMVLHAAEQIAVKNRGQANLDAEITQRVRRCIRHLIELRTAYDKGGKQWINAIRTKDKTFEQIIALLRFNLESSLRFWT